MFDLLMMPVLLSILAACAYGLGRGFSIAETKKAKRDEH